MVKNFLGLTLLSIGTPMLLMGDEVRWRGLIWSAMVRYSTCLSSGTLTREIDIEEAFQDELCSLSATSLLTSRLDFLPTSFRYLETHSSAHLQPTSRS